MESRKFRNLLLSLAVLAALAILLFFLSTRIDPSTGYISPLFTWSVIAYIAALAAAGILFILRLIRLIPAETSFLYMLTATTNFLFGVAGVSLYFLRQITLPSLHALLMSLLIGTILYSDIFFHKILFNKKEAPNHL